MPFNDLAALEEALAARDVAAFFVEPIQGKGVNIPADDYLTGAQALCRKYGTLFVADEIQTGARPHRQILRHRPSPASSRI